MATALLAGRLARDVEAALDSLTFALSLDPDRAALLRDEALALVAGLETPAARVALDRWYRERLLRG